MPTHPDSIQLTRTQLTPLLTIVEEVPDPRVTATVDHDLPGILAIALCSLLCGGDSFYGMEEFGQLRSTGSKPSCACATALPNMASSTSITSGSPLSP